MNNPFFQPNVVLSEPPSDTLRQSCPQARFGGFCGVRIQPECLRIASDGTVRVSLSTTARVWFEAISRFGEVLHLTRNPVAVMGKLAQIPMLDDWRNPVLPPLRLRQHPASMKDRRR